MKRIKKCLAVVLTVVTCFALSISFGCSGGKNEGHLEGKYNLEIAVQNENGEIKMMETWKKAYEEKLADAKGEADRVIKSAVDIAAQREREILEDAKEKADGIIRRAEADAILEKKKAEDAIRREIVEVSSALTEKMLEREITKDDHKQLIDSFIESIGEDDETN